MSVQTDTIASASKQLRVLLRVTLRRRWGRVVDRYRSYISPEHFPDVPTGLTLGVVSSEKILTLLR